MTIGSERVGCNPFHSAAGRESFLISDLQTTEFNSSAGGGGGAKGLFTFLVDAPPIAPIRPPAAAPTGPPMEKPATAPVPNPVTIAAVLSLWVTVICLYSTSLLSADCPLSFVEESPNVPLPQPGFRLANSDQRSQKATNLNVRFPPKADMNARAWLANVTLNSTRTRCRLDP